MLRELSVFPIFNTLLPRYFYSLNSKGIFASMYIGQDKFPKQKGIPLVYFKNWLQINLAPPINYILIYFTYNCCNSHFLLLSQLRLSILLVNSSY